MIKKFDEPVILVRTTGWNYGLARRISKLVKEGIAKRKQDDDLLAEHPDLAKLGKADLIRMILGVQNRDDD